MHIRRFQVDIESNQHRPGPDGDRSSRWMKLSGPKIRFPLWVGTHSGRKALQPTPSEACKVCAAGAAGSLVVQKYGNLQVTTNSGPDRPGEVHAVVHGDAAKGNEGQDIESPDTGVLSLVQPKIDAFNRRLREPVGRLCDSLRGAYERQDRSMVVWIGVLVQDVDIGHSPDHVHECSDRTKIASFTEIWNAFDDPSRCAHITTWVIRSHPPAHEEEARLGLG